MPSLSSDFLSAEFLMMALLFELHGWQNLNEKGLNSENYGSCSQMMPS